MPLVNGVGSADNASFIIVGNQLKAATTFDYETKSNYSIRVRTTDQGGLFFEQQFSIQVTDVNEAPTNLLLSASTVPRTNQVERLLVHFSQPILMSVIHLRTHS